MTLTTMWLAPDCWDEHFLFYNLSQNINSLKDILQILWTLVGPLFKGPAPSTWYQNKGPVIFYISCSITVHKIITVREKDVQNTVRNKSQISFCSWVAPMGSKELAPKTYLYIYLENGKDFLNSCWTRNVQNHRTFILIPSWRGWPFK